MLALRRLAAAQAHEARPLAAAFASSSPHNTSGTSVAIPSALTPSSSVAFVSTLPHARSSSSPRGQHQRRHSSSKPSSPPKDDAIAGTTAASSGGGGAGSTGSTSSVKQTRKRERRKEAGSKSTGTSAGLSTPGKAKDRELPSAPSTEHLDSQAINLASFFSLHRPISVTLPVPSPTTTQNFASLFQPSSSAAAQSRRVNESLFTLASAVRGFDKAIAQSQGQQTDNFDMNDLRNAMGQSSNLNSDEGSGPVMYVSVHELARGMQPFVPPPPPEPVGTGSSFAQSDANPVGSANRADAAIRSLVESTALAALRGRQAEKQRNLNALYTVRMRARRRAHLRRLLARTITKAASVAINPVDTTERRGPIPRTYQAISTRRRRYLKMKKHKFKKLQKLQKNEKRRQDRA